MERRTGGSIDVWRDGLIDGMESGMCECRSSGCIYIYIYPYMVVVRKHDRIYMCLITTRGMYLILANKNRQSRPAKLYLCVYLVV